MHECVLSTVATDALVLKHQAISIHKADKIFIVLGQFHTKISKFIVNIMREWNNILEKKITRSFKG